MKKTFIILILLIFSCSVLNAQKTYTPTNRHVKAAIVGHPESGKLARSYNSYLGLARYMRRVNRVYGTNYPTKVVTGTDRLKRLSEAARDYSFDVDHCLRFEYKVFTRYRWK